MKNDVLTYVLNHFRSLSSVESSAEMFSEIADDVNSGVRY